MVAMVAPRVASGLQWLHLGLQPDATLLTYKTSVVTATQIIFEEIKAHILRLYDMLLKTKNGAATAEVYHSGSHSPNFLYSVVVIQFLNSTRISSLL